MMNTPKKVEILIIIEYIMMIFLILLLCCFANAKASAFIDPENGVIVIDAGHGGVDGGANRDGILEKDINLNLALKLKTLFEHKGYKVILTRERDVSLDMLNQASSSRHRRDLIARTGIINESNARLFLSIHVNSLANNSAENGSMVFYSKKFLQSKTLAFYLQNELNTVTLEGSVRKSHTPLPGRYYVLSYTEIPGVIIETAFITNKKEKELLTTEEFLGRLAAAIASGTEQYLETE